MMQMFFFSMNDCHFHKVGNLTALLKVLCRKKYLLTTRKLEPACLHGGGGPQVGEVTCGGSPHLT